MEPRRSGAIGEYFVWKGNVCLLQTDSILELAEFLNTPERGEYIVQRIITSTYCLDDEELDYIRDFSREFEHNQDEGI